MTDTLHDEIDFETSLSVDSLFPQTIETARLRFEWLCEDTVSIRTLYTHLAHGENIEEATEYVLWSPHTSLHNTQSLFEQADEQWRNGDAANYVVRRLLLSSCIVIESIQHFGRLILSENVTQYNNLI